ncbi:MAG: M20/M25/M40 family metallo-hydrolase [Clostridiales bacterium]|nr:M20/M25/M40 family metallo-hydrolase [Clostridiales bacterium]
MENLIQHLSNLRGISGHESRINREIARLFKPFCDTVETDALGSVIACRRCGIPNAPKVMIEAHMDEIGLMVTSVTDEGFITFTDVGGVDERILPSLEVCIHGKIDVYGVIGVMPKELTDASKSYKTEDMAIDTGLDCETVKSLITPGDSISLPQSVGMLGKKQLSAKTMDDRASIAALIGAMKKLRGESLECDVYAVAAVQEELGCRGGKTTSFALAPDLAVAVDVTHGITPDNSKNAFEVGSGTVLSKGPNLHPRLTERLEQTAKSKNIKLNIDVDGGCTGTDAWEIQVSGGGIPTALLSIPLKYMHTSVETLAVSDVKATASLLAEFIKGLESDISWLSL